MTARWLSIIGIGEDGRAGLSPIARNLLDAAAHVIGGARHLALVGPTSGRQHVWSAPLDASLADILAWRGTPVCVLASGDPMWFGIGATLARHVPVEEMLVVPSPSCLSLAAARLGWPLQSTPTLGLNLPGTAPTILRHLHHGQRIFALSVDATTPAEVATLLVRHGFGASRMWVLEALGGPRERIRTMTAATLDPTPGDPLNVIAIDVVASDMARPIALAAGLPDALFEHDGQLTKREVRAVTLSSLAPAPGQLLWDVGLGSGSVAIEWLLAHPTTRAIGFERDVDRAARAARNAAALGVPHLDIRRGATVAMFDGVSESAGSPDAIFIGGGASEVGMMDACWAALNPGGRMVVNAVTLETETILHRAFDTWGGSLTRISIDRAERVGTKHGWRPAMPVLQWVGVKP